MFNVKMKEKSFRVYIGRQLRSMFNDIHITRVGAESLDCILRTLAETIVNRALVFTEGDNKKTILDTEIEASIKTLLPDTVVNSCMDKSKIALELFNKSELERKKAREENKSEDVKEKTQTRESRCGLIFSISAVEKYIRQFGRTGYNVSASAPVVLTSVLETLSGMFLTNAHVEVLASKKITMTVRHIFLALSKNPELNRIINNLNIVFLESGVVPDDIQIKKLKKAKKSTGTSEEPETDTDKRNHRWRPGTKTVMEIRKLQKNGDMLIQRAPFSRLIREVISKFAGEDNHIRYTGEFLKYMQAFCENRLINLMTNANKIVVHMERETVYERDINLAINILNEGFNNTLRGEYKSYIPEASIRQITKRAGIKRYGDSCTKSYQNYLISMLEKYMYDMYVCALHHKVQTLNSSIFLEIMYMHNIHPAIIPHKRRGIKKLGTKTTQTTTETIMETELSDTEN